MTYPFEQDFVTGIPSGFATNGGGGGITATWSEAQQAADLVFNNAQNFWRLNDAPLTTDFWFEMDVEIVASAAPPPHFGFWLWTGVATYEGYRLAVWQGNWYHSYWTSGGSEYEQIAEAWAGWAVVGARRTIRLDVKRQANLGVWLLQLSVDGAVVWRDYKRWYASFRPCIFGYGITLRVHRVAGDTPTALEGAPVPAHRRLPVALAHRILVPENAAAQRYVHRGLRPLIGNRNHYYHGGYRIAGTVKHRVKGVIANAPLRRRVLLIDQATYVVVRETWSDAATGAYSFDHIDAEPRYLVIAFGHERQHRAVVADNLRAQPMTETSP
ncbi:hypothetical protein VAR608DRAFT_6993 [Variovorax sp. HW608]|uniref:hypothetical protein n=1 Tax=Variovorax sp. HW608 TaxID=1034889 RepID=UPI0008201C03|nr:hypothetical protein [Variovorax sp. HW608]SCK61177.1 hypothetical protein VAR608DRAFT_6993 [Variovorax sp. HW608]